MRFPSAPSGGFTLTEVLVTLGPMAIVIALLAAMLYMGFDSANNFERMLTRDQLQRDLVRSLSTPRAIFNTCSVNPGFAQCFNGGPATCPGNVTNDFDLIDESGVKIGGTTATPAYFSKDGSVCTAATNTACAFRVTTQFRPQGFPEFCGGTCSALMPRDTAPPASSPYRMHELLIIRYVITPLQNNSSRTPLAERAGSIVLPLNDLYTTGCVPL